MNYKNYATGEVISESCYNKLPYEKQRNYSVVSESATHQVEEDDDGDFITTLISTDIILDSFDNDDFSSSDNSFDNSFDSGSDSSTDFGGGDFGGGGADSSW